MCMAADGGVFLTFVSNSSKGMLLKTDSNGEIQWSKTLENGGQIDAIEATRDGNYIIAGNYGLKEILTKIKPTGNIIWSKIIETHTSKINFIKSTKDYGYVLGGYGYTLGGESILKLDSLGVIKWSKKIVNGLVSSMIENNDGYAFAGVWAEHVAAFIKTDSLCNGTCIDTLTTPKVTINDSVSLTEFTSTYYPWSLTTSNLIYSLQDLNSMEISCTTVGIAEKSEESQLLIYPNPSSGQFIFSNLPSKCTLEIIDLLGNIILQSATTNDTITIDIGEHSKSMYFYRIINNDTNNVESGKLILE